MLKMAKQQGGWAIIVVLLIAVLVITSSGGINWSGLKLPDFGLGTTGDRIDVNKQIKFHFIDEYTGGPIASKSNTFQLYDSDGVSLLEDNMDTDANGHCTTGSDYASGKTMYVRYESSNDKQWWKFTVPQMTKADAESATYNLIRMEGFTIGTYSTDAMKYANGTAITDGYTINCTDHGDNPTIIYSLANTGNDNTGLKTSYDPLYGQNWNVEVYFTLSGTDYEKLIVYSLDWSFTLGTTAYNGKTLDAYKLTKHKVGFDYKSLGTQDITFWIDTTGLTASASVTLQLYVYAYADHSYAMNHGGSFGPEGVQLAEHTATIVN